MTEYPTTQTGKPKDLSSTWDKLEPFYSVLDAKPEGPVAQVARFLDEKKISWEDFQALDPRYKLDKNGEIVLAFAHRNRQGIPTIIKYRRLSDGARRAEGATVLPQVIGNLLSTEWIIAEGETDAARLHGLTKGEAAILVLPAGALAIRKEWVDIIPRGARVWLAHDDDAPGDKGAQKAKGLIPDAIRLRPPAGDWCEWDGDSEAFHALLRDAVSDIEAQEDAERRIHTLRFHEAAEWFQDKMENPKTEEDLGIPTPYPQIIPQWRPGRLYVLGGYPADGKSSLELQIIKAARPVPTGIISLEMGRYDLIDWIVRGYGIPQQYVETGNIPPAYQETARRAISDLATWDAEINDNPLFDKEGVLQWAQEGGYGLILLDHLHRFDYKGDRAAIETMIRGLKNVAKLLDIPVICLAQITRGNKSEHGTAYPRPHMGMIRESGLIEAESDMVFFVWRQRDQHEIATDRTEIIVSKNRINGKLGAHKLLWDETQNGLEYIGEGHWPEETEEDESSPVSNLRQTF